MHAVEQVVKDYSLVLLTSDDDHLRRTSAGGYATAAGDLEEGFEHAAAEGASTLLQVGVSWLIDAWSIRRHAAAPCSEAFIFLATSCT